ncbi:hypothetical protein FRC12_022086 [Ceratobasidium sp. 428]|nr:hypothetical protein FRC12_022086 [Ceratobasidium sp. 428]
MDGSPASKVREISTDLAGWFRHFHKTFKVYPDEVGVTDQLVVWLHASLSKVPSVRLQVPHLAKRNEERKGGHDFILKYQIEPDGNRNHHNVVLFIQAKNLQDGNVEFMKEYKSNGIYTMQCELLNQTIWRESDRVGQLVLLSQAWKLIVYPNKLKGHCGKSRDSIKVHRVQWLPG